MNKTSELTDKIRLLTKKISSTKPRANFPLAIRLYVTVVSIYDRSDRMCVMLQYDLDETLYSTKLSDGRIIDLCKYRLSITSGDTESIRDWFRTELVYDGIVAIEYTRLLRRPVLYGNKIIDNVSVECVF